MSSANASFVPRPLTWVQVRDLPRGAVCILDYKMHIIEFYMSIYPWNILVSVFCFSSETTVITIKIMMMKWCYVFIAFIG